ncbi:MAG TPA: hypothetical protein VGG81_07260 [Edaphobacter sp.]|jgi:hypothetical protein
MSVISVPVAPAQGIPPDYHDSIVHAFSAAKRDLHDLNGCVHLLRYFFRR